ncbi:MAG: Ig-like domain-containing protein, partial [Gemmatimonadaceae bacterium]
MDDSRALVPPPAAAPRDRLARSSRRVRRAALVSTIALAAGLTCRDDDLTGPGLPSRAHLAIVPTLQRAASAPVVTLARARARVTTIPAGTVLRDTVASFPADGSALSLELVMTLTAPSQLVELHLSGITAAGDTVYASFDTLTLVANATAAEPLEARLEWVAPDTAVKAMRLFPRDTTFRTSEQAQFRVVAKKADSTVFESPIVGWTSTDTTLATFSADGRLTAKAPFANLRVIAGLGSGLADTTFVSAVAPVASVVVTPDSVDAFPADTLQLTATPRDAASAPLAGREIRWSALDANVTVSQSGQAIVSVEGVGRVVATSEGKADTAKIVVRPAPVAAIALSADSLLLVRGDTSRLAVVLRDRHGAALAGRPVTWRSTGAGASVDALGLVTGLAADSVALVIAASEGKEDTTSVRVARRPVARVDVAPGAVTLLLGTTATLAATPRDAAGAENRDHAVAWSSLDPAVAAVSETGVVTAAGLGATSVRATAGGVVGASAVSVIPVPVRRVVATPDAASVFVADSASFTAATQDSAGGALAGRALAWRSLDPAVAVVRAPASGPRVWAVGVAAGTARVVAESEGVADTVTLSVARVPVATVRIAPDSITLRLGQGTTFSADVLDAQGRLLSGRTLAWVSRAPAVASVVGTTGATTAAAVGVTYVVATSEGRSDSVKVRVTLVPATALAVSPRADTVTLGDSVRLAAAARDSAGNALTGRPVRWSSANAAIASVDSVTGMVRSAGLGAVYVRARVEGVSDSALVTVLPVPVASVDVTPATLVLRLGQVRALAAAALDAQGRPLTGRAASWVSRTPAIASVDVASGVVTAASIGAAWVVATVEGHADSAQVTVTEVPVAAVSVAPEAASVFVTDSTRLTVSALDSAGNPLVGRAVTWTSANPAIAAVSATGMVRALAVGSVYVRAEIEGLRDSALVTVAPIAVASVDATPDAYTLRLGGSTTLAFVAKDSVGGTLAGRPATWSSNAPSVASVVAATGVVTGAGVGTAYVVATVEGKRDSVLVTVTEVPIASVVVSPETASIVEADSVHLAAAVTDSAGAPSGRPVLWSSANPAVATVDAATGWVKGASVGSAYVRAALGGKSDSALVSVTPRARSVAILTPDTALTALGDAAVLRAEVRDAGGVAVPGSSVTWSTPDAAVVRVNSADASATAVANGVARVIAASAGGLADTVLVTVRQEAATASIAPLSDTVTVGTTATFVVTAADRRGNPLPADAAQFESSAPTIASVGRSTGVATGVSLGAATITATGPGISLTASLLVRETLGAAVCSDIGTAHGSSITASETWTKAASPHHLDVNNVTVSGAGTVLTIEPGALVCAPDFRRLTLTQGARLYAVGTRTDSIRFLPEQNGRTWAGVFLDGALASPSDSSVVAFARNDRGSFSVENGHRATLEDLYVWRGSGSDFALGGSSVSSDGGVGA